jgi:hypothetical protein
MPSGLRGRSLPARPSSSAMVSLSDHVGVHCWHGLATKASMSAAVLGSRKRGEPVASEVEAISRPPSPV